jgi:hypothetical protein
MHAEFLALRRSPAVTADRGLPLREIHLPFPFGGSRHKRPGPARALGLPVQIHHPHARVQNPPQCEVEPKFIQRRRIAVRAVVGVIPPRPIQLGGGFQHEPGPENVPIALAFLQRLVLQRQPLQRGHIGKKRVRLENLQRLPHLRRLQPRRAASPIEKPQHLLAHIAERGEGEFDETVRRRVVAFKTAFVQKFARREAIRLKTRRRSAPTPTAAVPERVRGKARAVGQRGRPPFAFRAQRHMRPAADLLEVKPQAVVAEHMAQEKKLLQQRAASPFRVRRHVETRRAVPLQEQLLTVIGDLLHHRAVFPVEIEFPRLDFKPQRRQLPNADFRRAEIICDLEVSAKRLPLQLRLTPLRLPAARRRFERAPDILRADRPGRLSLQLPMVGGVFKKHQRLLTRRQVFAAVVDRRRMGRTRGMRPALENKRRPGARRNIHHIRLLHPVPPQKKAQPPGDFDVDGIERQRTHSPGRY